MSLTEEQKKNDKTTRAPVLEAPAVGAGTQTRKPLTCNFSFIRWLS